MEEEIDTLFNADRLRAPGVTQQQFLFDHLVYRGPNKWADNTPEVSWLV